MWPPHQVGSLPCDCGHRTAPHTLPFMLGSCKSSVSFRLSYQNFVHILIPFMRATYRAHLVSMILPS